MSSHSLAHCNRTDRLLLGSKLGDSSVYCFYLLAS